LSGFGVCRKPGFSFWAAEGRTVYTRDSSLKGEFMAEMRGQISRLLPIHPL
jgi:hypothetical protein